MEDYRGKREERKERKGEIMEKLHIEEGLTFDDILLLPKKSKIIPSETKIKTKFTKNIYLNTPISSAAMDTVTEAQMAIAMAQMGGIGVIHKNMSIQQQAEEVDKVKRSESGMIVEPITIEPQAKIYQALEIMKKYRISGIPVIKKSGKLKGIITNRDLRFEKNMNKKVENLMTKDELITVPVGTTLDEAEKILHENRIEKLLVVDDDFYLKGLITVKDIAKRRKYPDAAKDELGRLLVAAAVGVGSDALERAAKLKERNVDVITIDTAHGHSIKVLETLEELKKQFSDIDIVAGNIATSEAAEDILKRGADALKVGVGPGSICTTRVVTGVGVPQVTAILEVSKIAKEYKIPIIADGGIKFSGDITKALAVGADSVMIGSLLAGTDESPGEIVLYQGRSYKQYRGMGSIGAMKKGSRDRYFQDDKLSDAKLVPEGVEGRVPYRGSVYQIISMLSGGLRSGMGYVGAKDLKDLRKKAKFVKITSAGLKESHIHDVMITKESPNYRVE